MAFYALRAAARPSSSLFRPVVRAAPRAARVAPTTTTLSARSPFSSSAVQRSSEHGEETFEEFSQRYESEFDKVQDVFELQRNLNNAFAYDLVPSPGVITAALKAARRVNDFPTAVRIFEGIKAKVENIHQYQEYLDELKPVREELGINLKEDLYPEGTDSPFYNP
ncbi:Cytochrome c oxidase subunit 6 [Neophaeococcomyces mojaviensis]|uniref:Cytochrome c oxidase subunit 6 n=1 Tax=Neophaeococcomyces mojaviensis TaxID=3383035 RepID=A0ACC3A326_9EURO|nr:Cytochrome c oxidase subunit 6 [Knufia sp. JES_112]